MQMDSFLGYLDNGRMIFLGYYTPLQSNLGRRKKAFYPKIGNNEGGVD